MKLLKVPFFLIAITLFSLLNSSCEGGGDLVNCVDVIHRPTDNRYYEVAVVLSEEYSEMGNLEAIHADILEELNLVGALYYGFFNLEFKMVAMLASDIPGDGDWNANSLEARELLQTNYPCLDFDVCYFLGSGSGSFASGLGRCGNDAYTGSNADALKIAHETGHLMGAGNTTDCNDCDYIMCLGERGFQFANESQLVISDYITQDADCLDNESDESWVSLDGGTLDEFPSISINTNGTICAGFPFSLSVPSAFEASNWEFDGAVNSQSTFANSVFLSVNGSTTFIARTTISENGCNPLTIEKEFSVSVVGGSCDLSPDPLGGLGELCYEDTECFSFASQACIQSITVESNHNKLTATVDNSTICLTANHSSPFSAEVTITPTVACGITLPEVWEIEVNGASCN